MNLKSKIDVQAILDELGAKKTGEGQYMACCPAHGDESPSLAIKVLSPYQALFHCHAGCAYKDIILALTNYKILEAE